MNLSSIVNLRKTALAAAVGAGLMVAATTSQAVIVYKAASFVIPLSLNGLYLNVVNDANNLPAPGTGGNTVTGWDINLWSTTGLGFFSPAGPAGGAYVLSGASTVANLAVGSLIGAGQTYGSGVPANTAQFNLNSSNNVFGFRFLNEANGLVHYGWARFSLGATTIDPARTLVGYAFESVPGLAIQAGVVPEPGTFAMLGLGVAGLLLARRRMQS